MNNTKNQNTFPIRHTDESGEVREGQFTVKRLSVRDRSQVGMRKSQLAGGMYCVRDDDGNPTGQGLDEDTDYLNAMIAHLEVSLVQRPGWFNLEELADLDLVREVYSKVWEFESSFFRSEQKDGPSEGSDPGRVGAENGVTEHTGTGTGNNPPKVVDKEVQPSLDA